MAAATLIERIASEIYPKTASSEIQPLQWAIMRYLSRNPESRCTIGNISQFLMTSVSPVSRSVKTLNEKDFVWFKDNETDRRSKIVLLTEKGEKALLDDPLLAVAKRFERLDDEDREALFRGLQAMVISSHEA